MPAIYALPPDIAVCRGCKDVAMKPVHVVFAVVAALLLGFGVGALACGDGDQGGEGGAASSTPAATTGETGGSGSGGDGDSATGGVEPDADAGDDDEDGIELAPESANDPRPEAPDDVIGDRPGG